MVKKVSGVSANKRPEVFTCKGRSARTRAARIAALRPHKERASTKTVATSPRAHSKAHKFALNSLVPNKAMSAATGKLIP